MRRFAIDLPWQSVPNWGDFMATLSPGGDHIAYNGRVGNRVDAYVRSLDRLEGRPVAPSRESAWYAFSPDGEWLGLVNGVELLKVRVDGGLSPIWSPDGKELFFRNGGKLMTTHVTYEPEIALTQPVELFDGPFTLDLMDHQRWDVTPDSNRFLMVEHSDDYRLVVVQNWLEELERLVPTEP